MLNMQTEAIARIRQQWDEVIQTVIAACQGDARAAADLSPFLQEMARRDDWRALAEALRRIWQGGRDPLALFAALDDTDLLIAGDVLRGLGVDAPPAKLEDDDGGDMVSLDDFLKLVVVAAGRADLSPPGLAEQLERATRGMATQPNAPEGMRELGRVLHAIVMGEREPDVSRLPPGLADKVRRVLEELKA